MTTFLLPRERIDSLDAYLATAYLGLCAPPTRSQVHALSPAFALSRQVAERRQLDGHRHSFS